MKKLFKLFAPLLLALVMVLGSCLTVCAATSLPSTDKEYEAIITDKYHEGFPYAVFVKDSKNPGSALSLYTFNAEPFYENGYFYFTKKWSFYLHTYNADSGIWTEMKSVEYSTQNMVAIDLASYRSIAYSNNDIYRVGADKEKDEPFFRGPERPLVAAVRGAGPEEALKEVILLIPLSILFLAGYLGLRKALRLLLTLSRRA